MQHQKISISTPSFFKPEASTNPMVMQPWWDPSSSPGQVSPGESIKNINYHIIAILLLLLRPVHCLNQHGSSMTDIGRPVQLQNLTFVWMSPNIDFGQIRFIVSLVSSKLVQDLNLILNTNKIIFRI